MSLDAPPSPWCGEPASAPPFVVAGVVGLVAPGSGWSGGGPSN
jgi:hypothetical protein